MVCSNVHDRREIFPPSYIPKYFSRTEFETCVPACTLEDIDEFALQKLDLLRELCGFPLVLTCAYRSVEHDKSKGRSGNSYHCAGRAFDIYCSDNQKRHSIVLHAGMAGFNGIGIYDNFVHVDDRATGCLWYGKK